MNDLTLGPADTVGPSIECAYSSTGSNLLLGDRGLQSRIKKLQMNEFVHEVCLASRLKKITSNYNEIGPTTSPLHQGLGAPSKHKTIMLLSP